MNIKIVTHFMPWELDHGLLLADLLKQSIYYVDPNDTIYIDSALNLSSYNINWNESSLSKDFFIEKYKLLDNVLGPRFKHTPFIYDGDELYGHLDLQKTTIQSDIDYYWYICPDITFSNTLLYYFIETAKQIKNEYVIITPQISRCWDSSWDILTNENFKNIPCQEYLEKNSHEIKHIIENTNKSINIQKLDCFKFAGWCDFYNKNFIEKLVPPLPEWKGYGPWDLYSMYVCNIANQNSVDVNQYLLENQIMWFYDSGDIKNKNEDDGQLKSVYKKFIKTKGHRHQQRKLIEDNLNVLLNNWIKHAINSNIIKING